MELLALNSQFQVIGIIDEFESLIWTVRYSSYGDFELYSSVEEKLLTLLQDDYYLWSKDSDRVMIIEDRGIKTDPEDGNRLIITGRSLESILCRRIVWSLTVLSGNLQNGIEKLLDENVMNPTDATRKIDNFRFVESDDPAVTSLTVEAQFTGDVLYDAIKALCDAKGIGFKVTLSDDGYFEFSLYAGTDRSYEQTENPYVVFSPNFDNILNSNYIESKKSLSTVTLVAGEGEGIERKMISVACESGTASGLDRRELFTDARDISSHTSDETLSEEEYESLLQQRGLEKLAERTYVKSFDGEIDPVSMYRYGEHFFMGDIIQIVNEYGIEARSRVTEFIQSRNISDGDKSYPTFEAL